MTTRQRDTDAAGARQTTRFRDSAGGRWLAVALYAAFIFGLSSVSMPPVLGPMALNDKIKHFALYGVFAFFVVRALSLHRPDRPFWLVAVTVAIVSLYGASDEFHQSFVPGRGSEVSDWLADTFAAFVVASVFAFRMRR